MEPKTGDYQKEETQKFDNLVSGTYIVYAEITDVAGNKTRTEDIEVTLKTVTSGEVAITLTQNISYWTNTDVIVNVASSDPNFTLQTSLDAENWGEETQLTITENMVVYARLFDGVNGGEVATLNVGNIDKQAPTLGNITNTPGGTSLTLSLTVQDLPGGMAKVIWYYKEQSAENYTSIEENFEEINGTTQGYTAKTVTRVIPGLVAGATYNVYAEVYDVAGNETTTATIEAITNQAPVIGEVTYKTKTTNTITVTANAEDADGDKLTYTIYTSEAKDGPYTARGTAKGAAGANVTITASGLEEYTDYYYYVDVTDNIATDEGSKGQKARTYCPGNHLYCSGGGTTSRTCSSCGGSGRVSSSTTCSNCGGSGTSTTRESHSWVIGGANNNAGSCSACGQSMYFASFHCNICDAWTSYTHCNNTSCSNYAANGTPGGTHVVSKTCSSCRGSGSVNTSIRCSSCNGSGSVSYTYNCTHGYYNSHRYCSHGKTGQHDN